MKFQYALGATPLEPEELNGLIPPHITTQGQLNEWESENILEGENWLFSRDHGNFLTIDFVRQLHKKMFGRTWLWAGVFRNTEKNIGVDPRKITTELKNLLEDVICQITCESYPFDEVAYRFHHRLVSIHPFPNGNGRHARTMTDFLLTQMGQVKFTWGNKDLLAEGSIRKQYIMALRNADRGDYAALKIFVRS